MSREISWQDPLEHSHDVAQAEQAAGQPQQMDRMPLESWAVYVAYREHQRDNEKTREARMRIALVVSTLFGAAFATAGYFASGVDAGFVVGILVFVFAHIVSQEHASSMSLPTFHWPVASHCPQCGGLYRRQNEHYSNTAYENWACVGCGLEVKLSDHGLAGDWKTIHTIMDEYNI